MPLSTPLRIALLVVITVAVGFASSLSMGDALTTWYPTLNKPSFQPPNWLFAPVWTILYILMGIAAGLVWLPAPGPEVRKALWVYAAQLVANVLWTVLFFGLRQPLLALVDILLLVGLVAWCITLFRSVRPFAGWLLVPYLLWICFATLLNASIVVLN